MRWFVGDVQGCALELEDLLRAIAFDPSRDELWCVGDLVNRGPDSLATLRLWRDVGGRGVLGNHEVYALMARAGHWPRRSDTLEALFAAPDADDLMARLLALPVLAFFPGTPGPGTRGSPEVWAVHGGLSPLWSDLHRLLEALDTQPHDAAWLESDTVSFATRVRCCDALGQRTKYHGPPESCPAGFRPWDAFYAGSAWVVHGHWASRGHYRGARTLGLDSGCVYGGKLTAWCHEEDRIVQVPARAASA